MRNLIIVSISFLFSLTAMAQDEVKSVEVAPVVEEVAPEAVARLHMDKDWRVKKELSFETKKITKLC